MKRLPLYESPLATPIAEGLRLTLDTDCHRCALSYTTHKRCISAEGVEGKDRAHGLVMVLGDAPTRAEAESGRPMSGPVGRAVRRVVEKYWPGDYVLDYTARCPVNAPTGTLADAQEACAPYLRQVLADALPDRIIVLGHQAARAVLGRYVPPYDTRKNYSWVPRADGKLIPVFVLMAPGPVLRNKHLIAMLEEDFAWALSKDLDLMDPPYDGEVFIVENEADALKAESYLMSHDWLAYDCETAGKHFSDFFRVASVSCTPAEGDDSFVWGRQALKDPGALAVLGRIMKSPDVGKVGANEKYDRLSLRAAYGWIVGGFVLDVQLTKHLELPGCDASLEVLSETVGMGGYKQDFAEKLAVKREMIKRARAKSADGKQLWLGDVDEVLAAAVAHPDEKWETYAYALIDSPDLEIYNARDTVCTARAARGRTGFKLVQTPGAHRHVWRTLIRHTTTAVEQIEAWGIHADRNAIENFRRYVGGELDAVRRRLDRYDVNPNSPQQVAALLYDKLKLQNPLNPKSRSTDGSVLKALVSKHPVITDLREHRRLAKLLSAYGNLDKFIRSDGRIHPSLKIDGTETGRLACVDPGLHQIPRKKDAEGHTEGGLIKTCFNARPGYRLYQLDQSQIELRVAAMLSLDPVMMQVFASGQDLHLQTAKLISQAMWGVRPEDVTDAHRSAAKTFNFGLVYGRTDHTIAAELKCSLDDAGRMRSAILGQFRGLARFMHECMAFTRETGYVQTPWLWEPGRIRYLPDIGIRADDRELQGRKRNAENAVFNTPCQSLGSDITLRGLTRIVDWLQQDDSVDAMVVMTVHDSLLFEIREGHEDRVLPVASEIMRDYPTRGVPLKVDEEEGEAWGALTKREKHKSAA